VTADPAPPLGATPGEKGTTFRLWSEHGEAVELCLFDADGEERRVELERGPDGVWVGHIVGIGPGARYGYRVHGPYRPEHGHRFNPAKLALDPYARRIEGPISIREEHLGYGGGDGRPGWPLDERDSAPFTPKGVVQGAMPAIDEAERPRHPMDESVIYEVHVKSFTRLHPDLPEALRGTYAGLAHPAVVDHLRELGVTAVELLPVHQALSPRFLLQQGLLDYWGYNSISFLAPDPRYAATSDPRAELRAAIASLHAAGIEVLLDVVYNHTGEGDERGPTISFRGIDNAAYYRLARADPSRYRNDSGTGNTLDATHPAVVRLILDSLHSFAAEYGADGYRFDLATVLGRSAARFSTDAPLFNAMRDDPRLARLKLIAEPWDMGRGGYRLGQFPPGWSEWNDRHRDTVRRLWRGMAEAPDEIAARIGGSPDLFPVERGRGASLNFVTCHDGFTLRDLVSYVEKHNEANGEGGRDGAGNNNSVNFGVEGETNDARILDRRDRQRRALLATLLLSRGAAMLLGGDELGRTQRGNNNAYSQDNEVSWFNWRPAPRDAALLPFVRSLIALRRAHPLLRSGTPAVIGEGPLTLLITPASGEPGPDAALLLALNATDVPLPLQLPGDDPASWVLHLDSAEAEVAEPAGHPTVVSGPTLEVSGRSVVLLGRPPATSP
jgi:isoamylase